MRRLLIALSAAGVLAALPAPASAGSFSVNFHDIASGGVEVYDFSDCDSYCGPQPISVRLERAGATIGSAGPRTSVRVPIAPARGDLVRISKDGVERAVVPYDGVPSIDGDPGCIAPGAAALSGSFKRGVPAPQPFTSTGPHGGVLVDPYTALSVWRSGFSGAFAAQSITTAGERWTAAFPQPLAPGDGLGIWHAYTVATPVGIGTVWSWREIAPCRTTVPQLPMPLPPAPAPPQAAERCSAAAIAADATSRKRLRRAVAKLRLRTLRRGSAKLADLPGCAGGRVAIVIRARGAVVARGTAAGADIALARTKRTKRLAGRRRANVTVTVRITDADGGVGSWSRRLTLR